MPTSDGPVVLVHGTPVDGFEFIGPFDDIEAATDYATQSREGEWWICRLTAPFQHRVSETVDEQLGNQR